MKGFIIYAVFLSKKNTYNTITYLVILEFLVFLIIFLAMSYNQKFYKITFLMPFKDILEKIKKGRLIEKNQEYNIEELSLLSENYNEMLNKLLTEQKKLKKALEEIKILKELLPICSSCKKIRSDDGVWHHIETYLSKNHHLDFTHSLCPECIKKLYPDLADKILKIHK